MEQGSLGSSELAWGLSPPPAQNPRSPNLEAPEKSSSPARSWSDGELRPRREQSLPED